jgi:hypothetical protein
MDIEYSEGIAPGWHDGLVPGRKRARARRLAQSGQVVAKPLAWPVIGACVEALKIPAPASFSYGFRGLLHESCLKPA